MSTPTPSAIFSFQVSPAAVLSLPAWLWHLYLDYLWSPSPGSWVDSIASSIRILAILLIAPFALLTLLDVTSYVIARTLGVVDSTKASTSDLDKHAATSTSQLAHPIVHHGEDGEDDGSADLHSSMSQVHHHASEFGDMSGSGDTGLDQGHLEVPNSAADESGLTWSPSAGSTSTQSPKQYRQAHSPGPMAFFFNPAEERNLALSGANILSPAASRPSSPPLERRRRNQRHRQPADVSDVSNSASSSDTEPISLMDLSHSRCTVEAGSIMRKRGGQHEVEGKRD